jgi:hypothetical protein
MYKILLILLFYLISSCGVYNLDISISNPLDGVNIFKPLAKKNSTVAKVKQCEIEIDMQNWSKAVDLCSRLDLTKSYNAALYASALLGKNGGNVFSLIKAAQNPPENSDSLIESFITTLGESDQTSIDDLETAVTLLEGIENKTSDEYFQLAYVQLTLAATIINVESTANGHAGEVEAADIEAMTTTELDYFYDTIVDANTNLTNANVSGDISDQIDEIVLTDLGGWSGWNETEKETALKTLFGL